MEPSSTFKASENPSLPPSGFLCLGLASPRLGQEVQVIGFSPNFLPKCFAGRGSALKSEVSSGAPASASGDALFRRLDSTSLATAPVRFAPSSFISCNLLSNHEIPPSPSPPVTSSPSPTTLTRRRTVVLCIIFGFAIYPLSKSIRRGPFAEEGDFSIRNGNQVRCSRGPKPLKEQKGLTEQLW